jgi:hypothetical protein
MLTSRRRTPFLVAGVFIAIICIAILRLPDIGLVQFERRRVLTSAQAGWAYRLLVLAAIAQLFYGGFRLLRVERVANELESGELLGTAGEERVVTRLARTAAFMAVLTVVYGIASLALTGERGGFWLFAFLALTQGAWYYREVGVIAHWLELRGETSRELAPTWTGAPQDYVPPLARSLIQGPPAKTE